MTRDNEKRSGAGAQPPVSALAPSESDNSGNILSFSTPTEFVELPSGGKYYPSGHPLHGVDSVEIRYMTAKEEDILTNSALIKKGIAIDRMLQSIVKTPGVNVQDMLVGDKNALTVAARITGFGAEYSPKVTCPSCGATSEFSFDLNDGKFVGIEELPENVEKTDSGTFLISNLPNTPVVIEVRLMTGRDENALAESQEKKKKHKMQPTLVTDQLKMVIVSINGIQDHQQIGQFVENMPALTTRALRKAYKEITPNLDLTQHYVCEKCGHEEDMEVPFSTEFFWPKQ